MQLIARHLAMAHYLICLVCKIKQEAPLPRRAQRVRFWYRSKAHMRYRISEYNTNLDPILHRFIVMADYW